MFLYSISYKFFVAVLVLVLPYFFCPNTLAQKSLSPPVATAKPHIITKFGHKRVDNYYWLREKHSPEVLQYLEAENNYAIQKMHPTLALQDKLLAEVKQRINTQEASAYYPIGDYFYYQRYEQGQEYPIYCRKKGSTQAPEEVIFDVNKAAQGKEVFSIETLTPSDDHNYIALAIDTTGSNIFTIYLKDLRTGELLPEAIPYCAGIVVWASDNRTIFYNSLNNPTLRADKIWRHTLYTSPKQDVLILKEKDAQFVLSLSRSRSREYIFLSVDSNAASEQYFIKANTPQQKPQMIVSRRQGNTYYVEHMIEKGEDTLFMLTDHQAPQGRIIKCTLKDLKKRVWHEVVPHSDSTLIESFQVYKGFLVLKEQKNGLDAIRIVNLVRNTQYYLPFQEASFSVELDEGLRTDMHTLRYIYSSFTTPTSYFDVDLLNQKQTLAKQEKILGNFLPQAYITERLHAPASDGTLIPISLVYRKGLVKNGKNPLLLYGYGAYGINEKPTFNPELISLLDRGLVYAIAHVRGGKDLGRAWYEQGRLLNKKNSFTDFIACAEFLIAKQYTQPAQLFASGASAGGLLVAQVLNLKPQLFKGAILQVPFVDVLTTMLDENIPLTTGEFEEWGNPKDKLFYDYILSYSPYDQIQKQDYPHILVYTALNDTQVPYFEPVKWVAKLREMKTDQNLLLLRVDKNAGHAGKTGRFQYYEQTVFEYAFLLHLLGIND